MHLNLKLIQINYKWCLQTLNNVAKKIHPIAVNAIEKMIIINGLAHKIRNFFLMILMKIKAGLELKLNQIMIKKIENIIYK